MKKGIQSIEYTKGGNKDQEGIRVRESGHLALTVTPLIFGFSSDCLVIMFSQKNIENPLLNYSFCIYVSILLLLN